jgi:hypothetical protein
MPLNPKRVQAGLLEAANHHELANRTLILDRKCISDPELRTHIEAIQKGRNRFNDFANQPLVGPNSRSQRLYAMPTGDSWPARHKRHYRPRYTLRLRCSILCHCGSPGKNTRQPRPW